MLILDDTPPSASGVLRGGRAFIPLWLTKIPSKLMSPGNCTRRAKHRHNTSTQTRRCRVLIYLSIFSPFSHKPHISVLRINTRLWTHFSVHNSQGWRICVNSLKVCRLLGLALHVIKLILTVSVSVTLCVPVFGCHRNKNTVITEMSNMSEAKHERQSKTLTEHSTTVGKMLMLNTIFA